jgi:predicted 2-oxoglutarate/Fe(II)-dependent dioxygenase YbiX
VGWYNKLVKNGFQTAHIHPSGWLSGVIYLKTINQAGDDEGAIEFGLHGYELPVIDESYPRKVHRPESGDIVLFPSSLFHRTIPFTTDAERCVIAFDLKPIW